MVDTNTSPWKSLESWSPTVFLVAGILLIGYAGIKTVRAFAGVTVPDVMSVTAGHIGLLVPVIGLLGLYPLVRDDAPRLSLAGIVLSVTSAICSVVLLVSLAYLTLTVEGYPAIPEDAGQGLLPALWGAIILMTSILTLMLGFLLVGVASLRSDAVSRPIAYLLLVPTAMWSAFFLMHPAGIDGSFIGIITYVPIGASLLTIGYRLRRDAAPFDSTESAAEPGAPVETLE